MKHLLFISALALAPLLSAANPPPAPTPPPAESPADRDARMAWWREARFGMFVHWGLYSGLAGNWNGQPHGTKGGMEWLQKFVRADTATYSAAALPLFKPAPDFARAWARLAKEAGCRYLVFTTKHHEGFALHDSAVTDFDAGSTLNRDLVREIVDACRAEGLRVGFYHSVIDWHHDQYDFPRAKGLPHPLEKSPELAGPRDHAKYIDFLHAQVNELVSHYGTVDVLWWDFSSKGFQGDAAWRATDLIAKVRAAQPGIIMNNRLYAASTVHSGGDEHKEFDASRGDFTTPEQRIPENGLPGVDWETCMTLNTTWGYSDHDHAWKSDRTLIRNLIDIASKGGNYLLNIGPKGDGSLTPETVASFRAIGAWLRVNDESIYATSASPFTQPLPWGRATTKGRDLYLHIFDWPADGRIQVPVTPDFAAPTTAGLLSAPGTKLKIEATPAGLFIHLPASAPDPIASVVRLSFPAARQSSSP
jgi:alpha-L-fucosidase